MEGKKVICVLRALRTGGAERQLRGLALLLKERGYDVEVLTYHHGSFHESDLIDNGVRVIRIPKKGSSLKLARDLAAHFERENPNAVISYTSGANRKVCMATFFGKKDYRLIVSERNFNLRCTPADIWRFFLYRRADAIVPNCHAQEGFILKHFPSLASKVKTIVNFTDTDKFTPSPEPVRNDPPLFVTTARISPRKNLLGYIRAVGKVAASGRKLKVEWWGSAVDGKYKAKCLKEIDALGLKGVFTLHDASRGVAGIYRRADFFCLPSFYEGTPNSLCEAMACGLPVAASLVSDNAMYCRDGVNGFTFNPKDTDGIARAITDLLDLTPEQKAAFGAKSRDIVCSSLSKGPFIDSYISLIENNAKHE
ncbi:MAG: glycosyltransferase family 4 protein [Bacteroidales bacterium]|nr:glycosyltransferase family 4 protein [Bacteroidales bacterium]